MERNKRQIFETEELGRIGIKYLGMYRYLRPMPALAAHEHGGATEICYLEKGSQSYFINGREYIVNGGEVFITFSNELHSTGKLKESRGCLYWVQIDSSCQRIFGLEPEESEIIRECINSLNLHHFKIAADTGRLLISAFNDIASGSNLRLITARAKLILFIFGLVTDMAAYGHGGEISAEIKRCLDEIDKNIKSEFNASRLAASLNYSESYFKLKFKREVGIPPREFILQRKIELSKNLLLLGGRNVTDVALEFNFSSSQHYSRVFRDVTGMSPSEFIKLNK